jgi:hypothetical protein
MDMDRKKAFGCLILVAIALFLFEAQLFLSPIFWTVSLICLISLLPDLHRSFMSIKTTSDDPPRFEGRWKNLRIYSFTGYVRGSASRSDTSVSGSVYTVGNSVQGSVSSATSVTDSFRLVDTRTREESNFRLHDYDVELWENQLVSVAWAIPKGKKEGPYIAVVNHTTGDVFFKRGDLTKIAWQGSSGCLSRCLQAIYFIPSILLAVNFIAFLVMLAKTETQISRFKSSGIAPLVEVLNRRAKELPPLATV